MTDYLIRGANILGDAPADVLLRDGRIHSMGSETAQSRDGVPLATIDASGLIALPGMVDLHVHLREPGREDAETVETGSRAAAKGIHRRSRHG